MYKDKFSYGVKAPCKNKLSHLACLTCLWQCDNTSAASLMMLLLNVRLLPP